MNRRIPDLSRVFQAGAYGRPNAPWTPATISSLVADYDFNVGAFNDAGSTPAANGEGLYRLTPAAQPTLYAEQTSSGLRPIYNVAGNGYRSATLDGTDDYMSVADNAAFSFGTGDFFIIALAKRTATTGSGRYIWSKQKATSQYNGPGLAHTSAFKPYFECFDGTGTVGGQLTGATTLANGTYYRIGAGRTGSTGKILLNNSEDASGSTLTGSVTFAVAGRIGAFTDGSQFFKGDISRLLFFNAYPSAPDLALLDAYLAARTPA